MVVALATSLKLTKDQVEV